MECSAYGNWSQEMPSCAGTYFLANAEFGYFFVNQFKVYSL